MNRKIKSWITRLLSLVLCFCLLVIPGMTVSADTLAEAQNKKIELENEKKELDATLEQLKNDEQKKVEYQKTLEDKIHILQNQIDQAREQIELLDASISELELKIQKSEKEIDKTIATFKERIKALYKKGTASQVTSLEILFSSESLHDFSMKSESLKRITDHDEQTMKTIEKYLAGTEEERTECQTQKDELAQVKKDLEKNSDELRELNEENLRALEEIKDLKSQTEMLISENEDESAALISEIENLIEEERQREEALKQQQESQGGGNVWVGGGGSSTPDPNYDGSFQPDWPIPGVYYISQHYGNNGHKGIDIAGPYGTAIIAAESGKVIKANGYDSWGDSWGYYVLIYHNETFTTRYAHLSALTVYDGQYVTKGDIIGYEGSTGNSTGPHLHFEVYQNGTRVNPYPYIK